MSVATLREHQHELFTPERDIEFVFGTEDTGYMTLTPPAISAGDVRAVDRQRPGEDGMQFGVDFRGAKAMTFEMGVLTDHLFSGAANIYRGNLDYLARIESVWLDDRFRSRSAKVACLRTYQGGRVVRCYGRPRRYEEVPSVLTPRGYTPVLADFQMLEDRWYSDDEHVETIDLRIPDEGGLVAPLVAPLTTVFEQIQGGRIVVAGNRPTWLTVTFHGPVTLPHIVIGDLHIGFSGTQSIPAGVSVTVDPRPWVRSTIDNNGAQWGGLLDTNTPRMAQLQLRPGTYAASYYGIDGTGTSYAEVAWRDAYARP